MQRYQQTNHALGSTVFLTLVVDENTVPEPLFVELWKQITRFEQRFSRFQEASELSLFNQNAGADWQVSPEFRELLVVSKKMAAKTDGIYNPFILPALQRVGYKGSWPNPGNTGSTLNYEQRVGAHWLDVTVGDTWASIPAGSAIEFGGIGKGYLLDILAKWLETNGIENYWLSLGGDVICNGFDLADTPWIVAIQDALHPASVAARISNRSKRLAVATSGITKRKGHSTRGGWHHLIDPNTNLSADTDIATASIATSSAVEADVYAKCLVIVGSNKVAAFLESVDEQNAILQIMQSPTETYTEIRGELWLQ
jgi:thiamine biosynthesis lipoprotein